MTLDEIKNSCKQSMARAIEYFDSELKGVRTGRATPGLIEHLKVTVASYGSTMDLRELAAISAPEPALLVVKPYDPSTTKDIEKAILTSNLGFTPNTDGNNIRVPVAALSGERRQQLVQEIKRMAEAQRVAVRNARRDANKHIDAEEKAKTISEDDASGARDEVQKLTKQFEKQVDERLEAKKTTLETV